MTRAGPRPRDIALVCESAILAGTFAVSAGWRVDPLLPVLAVFGSLGTFLFWPRGWAIPAASFIGTFLCAFAYGQLREGTLGGSLPGGAASGSFLAQGASTVMHDPFLPYPSAALLAALLGGSSGELPSGMRAAMESSGNSYLVGMYGYKMHLLGETTRIISGSALPRAASLLIGITLVVLFAAAAGFPVSAVRAGTMVCASSVAELLGRRGERNFVVLLTAVSMVIWDPGIWGSRGFILSFLSIIGISLISPLFEEAVSRRFPGKSALHRALSFHAVTATAVNIAILPAVAVLYGSFPLISFISNVFAGLPLGAILWLGMGAATIGRLIQPVAILFTAPLAPLLEYEKVMFDIFATVPIAIPAAAFPSAALIAYYSILGAILFGTHGRD